MLFLLKLFSPILLRHLGTHKLEMAGLLWLQSQCILRGCRTRLSNQSHPDLQSHLPCPRTFSDQNVCTAISESHLCIPSPRAHYRYCGCSHSPWPLEASTGPCHVAGFPSWHLSVFTVGGNWGTCQGDWAVNILDRSRIFLLEISLHGRNEM